MFNIFQAAPREFQVPRNFIYTESLSWACKVRNCNAKTLHGTKHLYVNMTLTIS